MLKFDASIFGGELPVGLGVVGIAVVLPGGDFVDEDLFVGRLRLGLRNRGGRAPGSPARDRDRHAHVRKRLGANDYSAWRPQWGAPADYRALLHPIRTLDPGEGYLARHRSAARGA